VSVAAAATIVPKPRAEPPSPAAALAAPSPLKIHALDVEHYRFQGEDPGTFGSIRTSTRTIRVDDRLRVSVELSTPAHAYLIALNTDGTVEVCAPPRGTAPARSAEIGFAKKTYFPLTEGPGLQAFVVVASSRPLPPYEEWEGRDRIQRGWRRDAAVGVVGAWEYEDGKVKPASNILRGPLETRPEPEPLAPFREVCDELAALPGIEASRAIAFPVRPKD
jgi:hypothetical protein